MINKINFEAVTATPGTKKRVPTKDNTTASPDIAVSSYIGNMITTLVAENQESSNLDKVATIKSLIESNQYKVDANALAVKLYRSLFSKNMDI
jgi:anti-sigma28 factor (negative regulator of flagellin synthesis)